MGGKSSQRGGRKRGFASKKTIRHSLPPTISDAESTSSGDVSDDADYDEQTDDADDESEESEEPEVEFPSHLASLRGGTGPPDNTHSLYHLPEPDTWTGFPDSDQESFPDWLNDEELRKTLFDSDDDDQVYERVNEVSDSDNDDDEDVERAEAAFYEAQLQDEFNSPWASHFANQIDGMSAYGFGDGDSSEEINVFAFSGSDDLNDSQARRVHFEEHQSPALEKAMAVLADSPTISRSLLPAALQYGEANATTDHDDKDENQEDDYDCMSLLCDCHYMLTCKQPMRLWNWQHPHKSYDQSRLVRRLMWRVPLRRLLEDLLVKRVQFEAPLRMTETKSLPCWIRPARNYSSLIRIYLVASLLVASGPQFLAVRALASQRLSLAKAIRHKLL